MLVFNITIGISIVVICLIIYSALIVSGREEETSRSLYLTGSFDVKISEELIDSSELVDESELEDNTF